VPRSELPGPRVIVALDYASATEALAFVDQIEPTLCRVKIGKELFTAAGPDLVKSIVRRGFDLFLDLKFHDIPNTTARAVAAAADLGVWMVNVHASGGSRMMEAAAAALQRTGSDTLLTAVTVLTSMTSEDLREVGVFCDSRVQVLRLAALARDAGLQGVVCSAQETALISEHLGKDFLRVTPGIRPAGFGVSDDQRRTMTPSAAIANGSHLLVVGRPVTQADDPRRALLAILDEIGDH